MTVFKYIKTASLLLGLTWIVSVVQAQAQTQAIPSLGDGVVIAMMLNIDAGKSADDAVKAMKDVAAHVRKQPGLIDDVLLASTFAGNKPSHVHLSRWRALKDWEALSASEEFLNLLKAKGQLFSWSSAEVFKPVK